MGSDKEREMVNFVEDHGWAAVRLGASGGGTARNLPDVLMGDGGSRYWGVEEKYQGTKSDGTCYISEAEAQALSEFCTRFGAKPLAAVRYSTRLDRAKHADWFIVPIEEAPRTDSGNVKLNLSVAIEQGWPLLGNLV
jgi:Holliday junction resolvase